MCSVTLLIIPCTGESGGSLPSSWLSPVVVSPLGGCGHWAGTLCLVGGDDRFRLGLGRYPLTVVVQVRCSSGCLSQGAAYVCRISKVPHRQGVGILSMKNI